MTVRLAIFGDPAIDGDDAQLAAKCVSRYVADGATAYELLDMLGLSPVLFALAGSPAGVAARAARQAAGLTVAEAARQAGLSRAHLSNFEHGRRALSVEAYSAITGVLS